MYKLVYLNKGCEVGGQWCKSDYGQVLLDVVVFGDGGESKVGVLSCVWATKRATSPEVLVAHIALVGNVGMWDIGFYTPGEDICVYRTWATTN